MAKNVTVWKFPLVLADEQQLEAPEDSAALLVAFQRGQLCLWLAVPKGFPSITHRVFIRSTGLPWMYPEEGQYHLGSALNEAFVWHVFSPTLSRHV